MEKIISIFFNHQEPVCGLVLPPVSLALTLYTTGYIILLDICSFKCIFSVNKNVSLFIFNFINN